tara:strand:+ start:121 stop:459 length:339 start_codon:yes stop_codon:yes gene_type:complete
LEDSSKEDLRWLLDMWILFMTHSGSISKGYPTKVNYFNTSNTTSSKDFEDQIKYKQGSETNTIINDLPEDQRAAINYRYLGGKKPVSNWDYSNSLHRALLTIEEKAKFKGIL